MKRSPWFFVKFFFPNLGMNNIQISSRKRFEYEQLCQSNFMRSRLLFMFEKNIPLGEPPRELSVAVLGGSRAEPELQLLETRGFKLKVTLLGIEDYNRYLDLNLVITSNHLEKYDLILCSQVLEHIWNHDNSFKIFENLLSPGGHLWISCPASNRYHGSPEYYITGFHADYFVKRLAITGLQVLNCGLLGTRRNYFATHTLPTWLSVKGHRFPLFFTFENRPIFRQFVLGVRYFFYILLTSVHSARLTTSPHCATETWVVAKLSGNSDLS